MNKLKQFWNSLPHQLQAAIIVGASATGEFVEHLIEMGQLPHTAADAKHLAGRALAAGAIAAWAFYRTPSNRLAVNADGPVRNS